LGGIDPQFETSLPKRTAGDILVINLNTPLKFSADDIGFDCGASAAAGDYMNFTLIGWEEQN